MPHMAPIAWTLILIFSLALIMIMASMVYFSYHPVSPFQKSEEINVSNVNWKW
uniref:ATP synthase complex subunit 8 n=1 Tax=Lepas australis TaxID=479279 RepID=A0A089NEZ3_9CRUS|nr:ATP synthase F0 subunit 8 [Lepas australis]AIQ85050.1 ATP synthase F0 subunit 8 [Lepas australis]